MRMWLTATLLCWNVLGTLAAEPLNILSLERAQQIALDRSPTLASAQERVAAAEAVLRQARAAYWPVVGATGEGNRTVLSDRALAFQQPFNPELEDTVDEFSAALTGGWVLFDGFGRRAAAAIAGYGLAETESARNDVRRLVLAAVAAAYYDAQLARQNIRVADADLAFNQRLLREAHASRVAGASSLSDEKNFEVRMNAARSALIQQRAIERAALVRLAALIGLEQSRLPDSYQLAPLGPPTVADRTACDAEAELAYAVDHRPDLAGITIAVRRAEASVTQAQSSYWPRIALAGAATGTRPDDLSFENEDVGYFAGVTLSYDAFDGGARKGRTQEARALERAARHRVEDQMLTVAAEVRQAAVTIDAAQQFLELQVENSRLVAEVRELVEKEYRAGQTSLVRLNEAQRDRVSAEAELARARVRLRLAWQELHAVTARNLAQIDSQNER